MSNQEIKELSLSIKQLTKQVSKDKAASKELLFEAGIINKSGKLRKQYENLCIQVRG